MLIQYFYVNDPCLVITGYIWYRRPQPQILEFESVMRNKAQVLAHIIMYFIATADSVSIVNSNPRSSENCKFTTLWWWVSEMLFLASSGVTWRTFKIPNFSSLEDGFSFQFQISCVFIALIPIQETPARDSESYIS